MAKKLQELLSERSAASQKRIQKLAKQLLLDVPAHAMCEELESEQDEVVSTHNKKPF